MVSGSKRKSIGKLAIAVAIALSLGATVFALTPRHRGAAIADPADAQAAESALVRSFNAQHFDDIYDGAADELRLGLRHNATISEMKDDYAREGAIALDREALTTCYHQQVRMVRWWTSTKGVENTATFVWYVPDGRPTQLLMASINPGHAPIDRASYQAHRCDSTR